MLQEDLGQPSWLAQWDTTDDNSSSSKSGRNFWKGSHPDGPGMKIRDICWDSDAGEGHSGLRSQRPGEYRSGQGKQDQADEDSGHPADEDWVSGHPAG